MTTLAITPNWKNKTAKFRGTVAAGEHVSVTIQNNDGEGGEFIDDASTLRLRVVDPCNGRTLAIFPEPVPEGETPETWDSDLSPLRCTLNLNTVQMLKAVPPAANVPLLWVLDDYDNNTLYFKEQFPVEHWPRLRGEEEPTDLDNYKDIIAEFDTRLTAAEETIANSAQAASAAATAATVARDAASSAATAATDAQTGAIASKNAAQTAANNAANSAQVASDAEDNANQAASDAQTAQSAAEAAAEAAEAALPLDTTLSLVGKAAEAKAVGDLVSAENRRAVGAEEALSGRIAAEVTARETLAGAVQVDRQNLANEISRAQAAEQGLRADVTSAQTAIADRYTKSEVDAKIAGVQTFGKVVVQTLPDLADADDKTIYLVPRADSEAPDLCDEYVVVEESGVRRWEKIGAKAVDLTLDNTVTRTSANGVKSSGIWSAIWGALAALPTGFSSLYDWCVAQLAGKEPLFTPSLISNTTIKTVFAVVKDDSLLKIIDIPTSDIKVNGKALTDDVTLTGADIPVDATQGAQKIDAALAGKATKADATLNLRGPNHDGYTAWESNPAEVSIIWDGTGWYPEWDGGIGAHKGDANSTTLSWTQGVDAAFTCTATRTALPGYQLGSQADKPLASEAEAEALRTEVSGKASKSDVDPLLFAQYYPDGSVKSAAEFTAGIKYDAPDTTNRTITVKSFCNTGDSENDNSGLVGRVVIPPFVDANGNGYISDDGTRYKVVGVGVIGGGMPYDYNTNLTAIIAPITMITIGSGTFFDCSVLTSISFPSATSIGNGVFVDCSALTSVSFPAATSIGNDAFGYCSALTSVSLPSATSIGNGVFVDCSALASVDFGDTPRSSVPTLGAEAFVGVPNTCKIIVPDTQYDAWIAAPVWRDLVTAGYKFLRHSEWGYARKYEVAKKADKPATFTTGNLATLDANGNPTDSGVAAGDLLTIVTLSDSTETMASILARLNAINAARQHVFFDCSGIDVNPRLYLCTIMIDADANAVRVYDQVTGKLYIGPYDATETIGEVFAKAVDAYHSITVSAVTLDGVTVTGQTVTLREGVDASAPVYDTAAYNGSPVTFVVPKGFQYFVEITPGLAGHFSPSTATGVVNAPVSVTLTYQDTSNITDYIGLKGFLDTVAADPSLTTDAERIAFAQAALIPAAGGAKEIPDTFTNTAGTVYDNPMVVYAIDYVKGADGQMHLAALVQRKWCSSYDTQFDAPEGVECDSETETVAEDGVYYYGLALGETNKTAANLTLLELATGATLPYADYEKIYKSSLRDTTRISLQYGYNNWRDSAYRQHLNSSAAPGAWWSPTHVGDTAPSNLNSVRGYMAGCSAALLAAAKPVYINTWPNYITDGANTLDTVYETMDTFFLPSGAEVYANVSMDGVFPVEGPLSEYWKIRTGFENPSTTAVSTRIMYRELPVGSTSNRSAAAVRLRSANRGHSYDPWNVSTSGQVSSYNASSAVASVPACVIY